MTLKEQVIADMPAFFNVDEFGEVVDVDGVSMTCVLDGEATDIVPDGLENIGTVLMTRASNFEEMPVVNQRMEIDEKPALVTAVDEQQGVAVIRLQWLGS